MTCDSATRGHNLSSLVWLCVTFKTCPTTKSPQPLLHSPKINLAPGVSAPNRAAMNGHNHGARANNWAQSRNSCGAQYYIARLTKQSAVKGKWTLKVFKSWTEEKRLHFPAVKNLVFFSLYVQYWHMLWLTDRCFSRSTLSNVRCIETVAYDFNKQDDTVQLFCNPEVLSWSSKICGQN